MADVASTLRQWSTTSTSNSPTSTTTIGSGLAPNLQTIQSVVRQYLSSKGSDIASATTTDLSTMTGVYAKVTGNTTITGFGTENAGTWYILEFAAALTLTHNATSLILPGAANITTAAGDLALVVSEGSGNWRVAYFPASGTVVTASPVTNTLSGNVALSNTGTYFTLMSCAQGTAGTWLATGQFTVTDTAGAAAILWRVTDGTTIFASGRSDTSGAGTFITVPVSAVCASPAGNIRVTAEDSTSASGSVRFNITGDSKDSTLTVIRIA